MGSAYKNFWSLNTDEAVVTGILRDSTPKAIEVLMPLNAQMKDIDLILMNLENKKVLKIQVKGSRAYEPKKSEVVKYGEGSGGWFYFKRKVVNDSSADYFIFLVYVLEENTKTGRRIIMPHTLTIPTKELNELCKKHKKIGKGEMYSFYFWVNPANKKSFEFRDELYDTTKYLDKRGLNELNYELR